MGANGLTPKEQFNDHFVRFFGYGATLKRISAFVDEFYVIGDGSQPQLAKSAS